MAASCSDAGSDPTTGSTDTIQCLPQAGVQVTYYQFSSSSDMGSGFRALATDPGGIPYQSGDCKNSDGQDGTWTAGGVFAGDLACPSGAGNRSANFIWDDYSTNVLAAIDAPDATPANVYIYWLGIATSIN